MVKLPGRAHNDHCTCAEAAGENPECKLHGVASVVRRLRDLVAGKHSDLIVALEAADLLEGIWDDLSAGRQALSEGEQK